MPNVVTLSVLPFLFSRSSAVCADASVDSAHSVAASRIFIVIPPGGRAAGDRIESGVAPQEVYFNAKRGGATATLALSVIPDARIAGAIGNPRPRGALHRVLVSPNSE